MPGKGTFLVNFSFLLTHLAELRFEHGGIDWEGIFGEVVYSFFVLHQANLGKKFKMQLLQLSALIYPLPALQN